MSEKRCIASNPFACGVVLVLAAGCAGDLPKRDRSEAGRASRVTAEQCTVGFLELIDTAATLDGECAELFDVSLDLLAECELPAIRLARLCFAPGARGRGRPVSKYCAVELVKKYFHCVVPRGGRGPRQTCVKRAMGTLLAELPPRCHEDGAGLPDDWGDRRWSAPLCSGVNVEEVKEI